MTWSQSKDYELVMDGPTMCYCLILMIPSRSSLPIFYPGIFLGFLSSVI